MDKKPTHEEAEAYEFAAAALLQKSAEIMLPHMVEKGGYCFMFLMTPDGLARRAVGYPGSTPVNGENPLIRDLQIEIANLVLENEQLKTDRDNP